MMISKDSKQITLFFHPDYALSKKCIAIAESNKAAILPIDISKTKVSQTDWSEMADMLNLRVVDLIDTNHEVITSNFGKSADLDDFSVLKIIDKNPEVVDKPIAIRGNEIVRASHANDILKLQDTDTGDIEIP